MKYLFLLFFILGITHTCKATSYYVSNSGKDSNEGTSELTPWQTLNKVNTINLKAGDQILLKRGNTFYGSIVIKKSGRLGNEIIFGAYGNGPNPVITGFTEVSLWTNIKKNIWESKNAISTISCCNMVTVNEKNTAMGRYPNSNTQNGGFLKIDSNPSPNSIINKALSGVPDWTGAQLVIRTNSWQFEKRIITAQKMTILNYDKACTPVVHNGFFIQNDPKTLDQQDEWYFNPTNKKLQIFSTNQPINVKVASIEDLLTISNSVSYIQINGIDFSGANSRAIYRWAFGTLPEKAHHITIKNCNIAFSGTEAIAVCSYSLNIENNSISESNGMAMNLLSSKSVIVRNNSIYNSGILPGMGVLFSAIQVGNDPLNKSSILIEYNSLINSGHNAISFSTDKTIIRYNYIDSFNSILDDGGGIYGGSNAIIMNNIILNGTGAWKGTPNTSGGLTCGIYLDDNSTNNELRDNTVVNCTWIGIYLHNANNNYLHENIVYDNGIQFRTSHDNLGGKVINNIVKNNQFISKTTTQKVCNFNSILNDLIELGSFDNNYYLSSSIDGKLFDLSQPSTGSVKFDLPSWQNFMKQDIHSRKSTEKLINAANFNLLYNKTKTIKIIPIKEPIIDGKGEKHTDTITLQPYTSIVMIKDYFVKSNKQSIK